MTSPHGPHGQGSGGQQPSYPPGFAPYPFRQPVPRPAPSAVTAIIAALLAGLAALACLSGGLLGILGLAGFGVLEADSRVRTSVGIAGSLLPVLILGILLNVVAGILLAAGTVKLARRKISGRRLVVGGSALTLGGTLLSLGYVTVATPYSSLGGSGFALLGLVVPIATLVMVSLPPTTAWLRARRTPPEFY